MGKVARVALPIAALGGLGWGAGLFSGAAGGVAGSTMIGGIAPAATGTMIGGITPAAAGLGGMIGGITPAALGGSSAFSLGSLFNTTNMSMLGSGLSALSSFGGMGAQQDLMAAQQAEIQRQKELRSLQILQEQREYREKAQRIASIARNTMTAGQSKRAFLRDNENRMKEGLSNIGLTGRYDMASFDSDFTQAGIAGRSGSYSSFIKGSRSLISGASNYAKTRTG